VLRHVAGLAAAALVVAAAGVVEPAPAQAATCSTASGVSVVVDFHQLGGGVQTFCDAGAAGETADQQFEDAGHALTYVQGEPFVCQVDGKPDSQCTRTPPANAYWSLWWSDGKSGTWEYSSTGVTTLKVPDGGYVALSWQGQSSQAKPRVTPAAHSGSGPSSTPSTASPSPHTSSSPAPTSDPTTGPTATPAATSGVPSPGTKGPASRHPRHHASSSDSPKRHRARDKGDGNDGTERTRAAGPVAQLAGDTTDSGGSGSGGLPGWLAPVVIAVLFAGAGATALVRRKRNGGP